MEETNEKQKEKSAKEKRTITVPANGKGRHVMPLLNFLRMLVIPVFWLCLPFRFYGKRKVADGACVYVCNHYRIWDVIYPAATTWEGIHFVSKKSVTTNWFMKGFCKRLKVIEVNRDGSDVRAVMDSLKCLRNGKKFPSFPRARETRRARRCFPSKGAPPSWPSRRKFPSCP